VLNYETGSTILEQKKTNKQTNKQQQQQQQTTMLVISLCTTITVIKTMKLFFFLLVCFISLNNHFIVAQEEHHEAINVAKFDVDYYNVTSHYLRSSQKKDLENHNNSTNEQRMLQSVFSNAFSIVKAGQATNAPDSAIILGTWTNGASIDIAAYKAFDISLILYTASRSVTQIQMDFESPTRYDYVAPWSLRGQIGNNYIGSSWMKILGTKIINVRAYNSRNRLIGRTTLSFTLYDSSLQTCTIPKVRTITRKTGIFLFDSLCESNH
jgi:hypothetical protein